jgi:DNA invertase Pin-like site-specific DNA recombinase
MRVNSNQRRFTRLQAEGIRLRVNSGEKQSEIAKSLNCSPATVCHIASGKIYREAGGPVRPAIPGSRAGTNVGERKVP